MKNKLILLLSFLFSFICQFAFAQQPQGALTIFSEDGDKFYLILNGQRQNNAPQTNVRVDGLTMPNYNVKVIFENPALKEINKNYLMIADVNNVMMDVVYKIKKDGNGNPKIPAMPTSFVPYQQTYQPAPETHVVHYGQPDVVQQTTVTTTTTTPNTTVNMNLPGVSVTVTDPNMSTTQTTTTRTTTTTTTTGDPAYTQEVRHEEHHRGCREAWPMNAGDFASALNTIKGQGFDETKLSTAKQIAGSNCLSANQIADICKTFGFEETKLDFAKFAYKRCTEPNNYFKINNVFGFSSSVEDLNSYIQQEH